MFNSRDKYVTNTLSVDVYLYNHETVAINTPHERFCLKGDGIAELVEDVLCGFAVPTTITSVLDKQTNKYSIVSLSRLIDMFIAKKILITDDIASFNNELSSDVLAKTIFYTISGKSLKETLAACASVRLGLIGTNHFNSIISSMIKASELGIQLEYINTDNQITEVGNIDNDGVHTDSPTGFHLASIIEQSDMIILSTNFCDHHLFEQVNSLCLSNQTKLLCVIIDGYRAEIGPLIIPGLTACYSCFRKRNRNNMNLDELIFDTIHSGNPLYKSSSFTASFYPISHFAAVIAYSETMKFLLGLKCALVNCVSIVDGLNLGLQKDYVFRDHSCPSCI